MQKHIAKWENSIVKCSFLQRKEIKYRLEELSTGIMHSEVDYPLVMRKPAGNTSVIVHPISDEDAGHGNVIGFVRYFESKTPNVMSDAFIISRCVRHTEEMLRNHKRTLHIVGDIESKLKTAVTDQQTLARYTTQLLTKTSEIAMKIASSVVKRDDNPIEVLRSELGKVIEFDQLILFYSDAKALSFHLVYEGSDGISALGQGNVNRNEKTLINLVQNLVADSGITRYDEENGIFVLNHRNYFFILQTNKRDVRDYLMSANKFSAIGQLQVPVTGVLQATKLQLRELSDKFAADFHDIFDLIVNYFASHDEFVPENVESATKIVRNPLRKCLADGVTLEGFAFDENKLVYHVSVDANNADFDIFKQKQLVSLRNPSILAKCSRHTV
jgi:hypothetical protein